MSGTTGVCRANNNRDRRYKGGLYFYDTSRVCVAANPDLKMRLLRETHDPHILAILVCSRPQVSREGFLMARNEGRC